MGLSFGQGGTPMYRVVGAIPSPDTDLASLNKCIVLRFTPQSTNNNQIILSKGGLTLVYNGTTKNFVLTQQRATTNYVSTFDYSSVTATLTLGTEYNVAFYYDTVSLQYQFELRQASNKGGFFGSSILSTSDSTGGGAFTAQTGAPSWGGTSDVAASLIADTRDACLCTFDNINLLLANLDLFGRGGAPFQFNGVTLWSCPAAINTEAWDRRPGAAAALTVGGTTNVLGISLQDGPTADLESSSWSTDISASLGWRINTNSVIYTSGNRVVEMPDLTGNLGHISQITSTARPYYEIIDGRPSVTFPNQATPAQSLYLEARAGSGSTFSGTSAGFACNASMTAPFNAGSSSGRLLYLKENGASGFWLPRWNSGATLNSHYFGLNHNAQDVPNTQSPRLTPPAAHTPMIVTNNGNTVHQRIGDIQASTTQTATSLVKFVYQFGYQANNDDVAAFSITGDAMAWTADKTAKSDAICMFLASRASLPYSLGSKALVIIGSSTEAGAQVDVSSAASFPQLLNRTKKRRRIINCASAGVQMGDQRVTVSGGSGTFVVGETITQATSGATGKFIGEGGGSLLMYDFTGTWNAVNGITGGTSGATRNVSAENHGSSGTCYASAAFRGEYALQYSAYTGGVIFLLNMASNGIATLLNTAACEYDALKNFIGLLRSTCPNAKFYVRPHQPRTAGTGSEHLAYRDLLRSGAGVYFDRLIDISANPAFDDFTGSTDYGNTTYYNADQTHPNAAGHALMALIVDRGITTSSETWRERGYRGRTAVR